MMKKIKNNDIYIIAETAYGFEGDSNYLLEQTLKLPKEIQAIKYHMLFNIDEYMRNDHSVYNLLKSWIISKNEWINILQSAKSKGHDVLILVDDIESLKFLDEISSLVDAIEVHAACLNDINLLNKALEFVKTNDKTLFIGISGFEIQELFDIVSYIKEKEIDNIILMYGFQNFPTSIEDVGLTKIPILKNMFSLPVGYADHTKFDDHNKSKLIESAYVLGANIQEIHYVLNEGEKRTDSITALSSEKILEIFNNLNIYKKIINDIDFRLNPGEKKYLNFRKVPVYAENLKKGTIISRENIKYIRVENPIIQHKFLESFKFIGKKLGRDVTINDEIVDSDFIKGD